MLVDEITPKHCLILKIHRSCHMTSVQNPSMWHDTANNFYVTKEHHQNVIDNLDCSSMRITPRMVSRFHFTTNSRETSLLYPTITPV
jgi:hypothetical protein